MIQKKPPTRFVSTSEEHNSCDVFCVELTVTRSSSDVCQIEGYRVMPFAYGDAAVESLRVRWSFQSVVDSDVELKRGSGVQHVESESLEAVPISTPGAK